MVRPDRVNLDRRSRISRLQAGEDVKIREKTHTEFFGGSGKVGRGGARRKLQVTVEPKLLHVLLK